MIRGQMFSRSVAPTGQALWEFVGSASPTYSWVVPAGVFEISAVCINSMKSLSQPSAIWRGASVLLRGDSALGGGVGGGDGGLNGGSSDGLAYGGAGGAGGYTGNGGNGAFANRTPIPGSYEPNSGNAGSGGGGGGGGCVSSGAGSNGGGVGVLGIGANGAAGGGHGGDGSQYPGSGSYGAGRGSPGAEAPAGDLRWKNAIPVTPGETLTIKGESHGSSTGAVRIMWGGGRSYPSNALNM